MDPYRELWLDPVGLLSCLTKSPSRRNRAGVWLLSVRNVTDRGERGETGVRVGERSAGQVLFVSSKIRMKKV